MRAHRAVGSLALLCVLLGCDEDSTTEAPPIAADAGGGGGGSEGTPDAGADDEYVEYIVPSSEDELTLRACAAEQPCEFEGYSQQIETAHDATLNGTRCVLEALAEGRTGRYLYRTEFSFTNGNYGAKHVLIVNDDRSVLYARTPFGSVGLETWVQPLDEALDPGQRCRLKAQSFFEECLAAVAEELEDQGPGFVYAPQGSRAFVCAFGDGDHRRTSHLSWFEDCETESPIACE
jgi:hypothetical protein